MRHADPTAALELRPLLPGDPLDELTAMLHRAYRPLAERGMQYLASHQDTAMTRTRALGPGCECIVALCGGAFVGTIALTRAGWSKGTPWYERPGVAAFGQFAVDPAHQGRGIGGLLLGWAEARAAESGAAELACDTSEHAHDLIRLYTARGYRAVETVRWDVTNYRSVVLSKALVAAAQGSE